MRFSDAHFPASWRGTMLCRQPLITYCASGDEMEAGSRIDRMSSDAWQPVALFSGPNLMFRFCADREFPSYSYVPGRYPHPFSDPNGHSYKLNDISKEREPSSLHLPPDLCSGWQELHEYLFGIDLFNHGFYWEAHETWEQLWIKFGRSGREADFLKALIKLAAAGVKARECRPVGVQRHACRARDLFQLVLAMATENQPSIQMGGMNLQSLRDAADTIASNAVNIAGQSDEITSALPLTLLPGDIKSDGVPSE